MTMRATASLKKIGSSAVFLLDDLLVRDGALKELKLRDGINESLYKESSESSMDRLDAKAGSLLTHISMMVAIAAFVVASQDTSRLEQFIIGAELTIYLFLALCCLRCLLFVDLPKDPTRFAGMDELLRSQVLIRGVILNFAIRCTFVITFVFAISLMAHLAF